MLFIYSELALGGIQTFYVRMAKARYEAGLKTKILLVQNRSASNPELLTKAMKYAEVYFLEEIVSFPKVLTRCLPKALLLIMPLNRKKISEVLKGIEHTHVSNSVYGFLYLRMSKAINVAAKLSFGVYHSREYIWDFEGHTPYYQKANKMLFMHNAKNQVFFNEKVLDHYRVVTKSDLAGVNLFPIGVTEVMPMNNKSLTRPRDQSFCIGSIGRLVSFKSYNLWMLDVVKELIDKGLNVTYIVYGKGPLEDAMRSKIRDLGITDYVDMRGFLNYQDIECALGEFDVFVGSGTSIVDASAKGIPSLIGIESTEQPLTYGFFSDIPGFTYNEDGLYPKHQVISFVENLMRLSDADLTELQLKHMKKAQLFSMEACLDNFLSVNPPAFEDAVIKRYTGIAFRLKYSISSFIVPRIYSWMGKNPATLIYG